MKPVLIYVQHLLGIGHLKRIESIANTMAEQDIPVIVLTGGIEKPDFDQRNIVVKALPGIKTDTAFSNLYDDCGEIVSDPLKTRRIEIILDTLQQTQPGFILIETFPFGRRQMGFEIIPLIEHAKKLHPRPKIASSIRDIIQPKSPGRKTEEVVSHINTSFDYVLVHGDKNILGFDHSFPESWQFSKKLIYTGYVSKWKNASKNTRTPNHSVIVSAGGGAVGKALYMSALDAANSDTGKSFNWHILVGNNLSETDFLALIGARSRHIKVERNRSDFFQLLLESDISISQAGYNTMMDILLSGTKGIVVPFEGVSEKEQLMRAKAFEALGLIHVIREYQLNADHIISSILEVNGSDGPESVEKMNTNGAEFTARFVAKQIIDNI